MRHIAARHLIDALTRALPATPPITLRSIQRSGYEMVSITVGVAVGHIPPSPRSGERAPLGRRAG